MSQKIEKLTPETLSDVVEIGKAFTSEVGYPGGFDFESFAAQWKPLLELGIGEIFVTRDPNRRVTALFGAVFSRDPFSGWLVGLEQFWYCLPEFRGGSAALRLLSAFENESKKRGCRKLLMVHLAGKRESKLEALYLRRGYSLTEKTFSKVI